jgi:7-cyano-7-deazaguanine synthase
MTTPIAVVLLSGGIDSTVALRRTLLTWNVNAPISVFGLTVNYGQTHAKETEAARKVAATQACRFTVVDARQYQELAWASALTARKEGLEVDGAASDRSGIPASYVPLRNTMLLTMAAALLESHVLHAIEKQNVPPLTIRPRLVIGANADDYDGYPDCRPEFYGALERSFFLGSKLGSQYGLQIGISTPLIHMRKDEIIRTGLDDQAPLHLTWSCYKDGANPCGRCDACRLRAKGFAEVGVDDPALARLA